MLVTVNLNLTRINESVSEVSGSKSGSNENGNGSEVVPGALKSGSTTSKISGNPVKYFYSQLILSLQPTRCIFDVLVIFEFINQTLLRDNFINI